MDTRYCLNCNAAIARGMRETAQGNQHTQRRDLRREQRLESLAEYAVRNYCSRDCNQHRRQMAAMDQVAGLRERASDWDAHVRKQCAAGRRWLWGAHNAAS